MCIRDRHIGSLVQIMILVHLQRCGHKPFALVGGATGMVGDPSGKSEERKFLTEETLQHNLEGVKLQLKSFLDFDCGENSAEIVNNYDWFKEFSLLDFLRDAGKHLTVNYMMSKDSVKKRLETGISFTEFSYQLIQGYDFYHLNKEKNCKLQMGGSDQWGNITTGTEFIRRLGGGSAFALTCPLITKSDGTYLKGLFTTKKDEIFCLYGEGKSKNEDNTSTGNIHNNKPFGKVKIVHSSGAVYRGDFFNDMPWTGKGKIINGDMSIEGEFVEAQGLAFIKDVNMTIYGEVLLTKNKKFNVYGFYLSNDGDKFSGIIKNGNWGKSCLLYTSPSPRDATLSRMPSSA